VALESSLFSEPLDTVGKLDEAIKYNDQLDFIARLPFVADVHVKIATFTDPQLNVDDAMDPALALQNWRKIKTKANRGLKVEESKLTGNPARDQQLYREALVKQQQGLATVDARIRSWGVTLP
jgi:hypothetical protein